MIHFSALPAWQLWILTVVISAIVAWGTLALLNRQARKEAFAAVADECFAIGRELRRIGRLQRGAIVEAAAETVKALAAARRIPPWWPHQRKSSAPESPVDRYVRELRAGTWDKPEPLIELPKKPARRERVTILDNTEKRLAAHGR